MAATFLYESPVVHLDAVSPGTGAPTGGTDVVLLGRGFAAGATVTFDGVSATAVTVESDRSVSCTTPAHVEGTVDVVLTNPDASTATSTGGYRYETAPLPTDLAYVTPSGARTGGMRLENSAPRIHQALGEPATFTFTATTEPRGESVVEFSVLGVQLFLGTVLQTTERVDGRARLQCWDVQAADLSHRLVRRRPTGTWTEVDGSTVIHALMATFAPDFTAVIEPALGPITLLLDGSSDLSAVLSDVCARCGARWFVAGTTLRVFTEDSGFDPPDDVTVDNPDLLYPEGEQAVTIAYDYRGLRNRITVRGAEGLTARLDDPASIAAYGSSAYFISDNTLTTIDELLTRARLELERAAQPVPEVHYATRDLKTRAGKTVTIDIDRPAISGDFVIESVEIDQFGVDRSRELAPRFKVTAKPAAAPGRMPSLTTLLRTVVDLEAAARTQPKLDGDIVADKGGRTTIPAASIPATKLAGCIPGDKLTPHTVTSTELDATGVTADTYGDGAHVTTFVVGPDGRLTAATIDPVPIIKTDGSQPYTADQPMDGHTVTGLAAPSHPDDAATKSYVDAEIAAVTTPSGVVLADGTIPFTADESMGGFKLTDVGTPTGAQDAATKAYVDAVAAGPHALLSATHTDTTAATPSQGALITSDGTTWKRKLPSGVDGRVLVEDSAEPDGIAWATYVPPPPPAIGASVYRSTNQSATVNAPALILFDGETYDPDGSHDGGVAPSKLTVQADGKYAVVAQFTSATLAGAGFLQLQIAVNAAIVAHNSNGQGGLTVQCAVQLDLTAGDYVEAVATINESGGTVRDIVAGAGVTFLQMLLIEPGATGGGGSSGPTMILGEVPSGAIDGSNRFYTTADAFSALDIFLNGLHLQEAMDFETLSTTTFSLFEAPIVGDTLVINYEAA